MNRLLKLLDEKLSDKRPKFRNIRIYPKILEEKNSFTPKEKAHLTRKGFYWYVYYDFKNPKTGKFERQANVKNRINQRFPDFEQRLIEIKRIKTALIQMLKEGHDPYKEGA